MRLNALTAKVTRPNAKHGERSGYLQFLSSVAPLCDGFLTIFATVVKFTAVKFERYEIL